MIDKKCNPKPDARGLSRSKIKDLALEQFLLAYAKGERTGHVESEDLDIAFEMAQEALPGAYESIVEELQLEDMEDMMSEADSAFTSRLAANLYNPKGSAHASR